jgi:hypothetical protein
VTAALARDDGAAIRAAVAGIEGFLTQDLRGIEVKSMRAITRTGGLGLLLTAAVCLLGVESARAAVAICKSPADVPGQLFTSIETCFNCTKNGTLVIQNPCPPAVVVPGDLWVNTKCYEFPADPTEAICDQIAESEVGACNRAVQDAVKCNDGLNGANAKAATASCQTLPDPGDQKTCASDVASELSALSTSVKSAATAGLQACGDLKASVRAACLGDTF